MRTPPLWAGPKILGPAAHCMATMGVPTTTSTTVHKRAAKRVLETAKKSVVWGVG